VGAVAMSAVDGSPDDEDLADHPAQDGGAPVDDLASPVAGNSGLTIGVLNIIAQTIDLDDKKSMALFPSSNRGTKKMSNAAAPYH
jgi:hypothetical protein